jgi:RHS repeat-associated protein
MNRVPSFRSIGMQMRFIRGQARLGLLLGSLLLIITTGLFAYMAYAVPLGKPVYGPETFNRGLYFRFFQVAAPAGQYTLTVQNGNPATGQNRVDSAVITLNLKTVVGLRDLNSKTASVTKTVTLNKINVLTFLVVGKQGSFITFSINGQTANTPPVANAGADQSGEVGSTLTLDGSASSDFDGDLLTYNWNLTSKPTGSTALLTNPNTANPTLFLDKSGTYVGSLVVNDGKVNSAPDTVTVSTLNVPPVADAGSNQRARVNTLVTLDGSGSTDADGNPLTYAWSFATKPTGSAAQLSNTTAIKPTFTVDKPGTYILQLVVNDGKVNSQAAQVIVTTENSPPVSNAGADQSAAVNTQVTLDGSASSDVDGDLLTYAWSFASRPTGSTAALSNSTAVNPVFTVDKPGSYTLQLLVKDGVAESLADTVVITTLNTKPVANAGADQSVVLELVSLNGTGSNDADGDVLTYAWTLTAKPTGSTATLLNPTSAQPSFSADKAGTYVAQLIVNDGTVDSDPATVTISTLNSKPVANAGADQTVPFNTLVRLDGTGSNDADNDPFTYAWSFTSKPVGSNATLTGNTTADPSFTGDVAGIYVVELIVNDGKEASTPDTVTITVEPAVVVNVPPTFTSIPVTQATEGEGYSYQVTAIDGNSDPLSYSLINNPPQGMAITSTGLITWIPNATQIGDFLNTVTVTDNKSPPVEQSFTITVKVATVAVPNVAGLSQAAAQTAITGANLTVGTITQASSATVPAGNVISQDPTANTSVAKNTAIALEISTGPANGGGNLPPDPATVAPTIDPTVATTTFAATQFLYTGNNPIQTGVAQGTIDAKHAAVIRGKVMDKTNAPLSGVAISILNHPEFGQTLSRADGMFDMVVNGGGILTVNYQKAGYLPSQRQVNVPWQDYVFADDVVLIQPDSKVTTIDLTNTTQAFQVAQGSMVTDNDGTRQATLLIPQGTQAQVYNPDGTTRTVTSLNLRLTEYTVGDNGPETMPGPLPPTSAYTYALDITAEEASIKIAGKDILLSQPVYTYIDNFLNFPVGAPIPVGYYDKSKSAWVGIDDGYVIKILSITNGMADLDTDGDNIADNGVAIGVTNAERAQLATLYQSNKTLWRTPHEHLSNHDYNQATVPGDGATPVPGALIKVPKELVYHQSTCPDSVIGCEGQTLGELVSLTGSSFSLNYQSDRMPGRKVPYTLDFAISEATVPAPLRGISVEVTIAGKKIKQLFPPNPNQRFQYQWDGFDVFGRKVQGQIQANIRVGYIYAGVYARPGADNKRSWARFPNEPYALNNARQEVTLFQSRTVNLGALDNRIQSIAGWTLDIHHSYDPSGKVLYKGDGTRIDQQGNFDQTIVTTVVGGGASNPGNGGSATAANLAPPQGVVVAPDGGIYLCETTQHRVRRVGPDGIITAFAGNGLASFSGDGGPATAAGLNRPRGLAVGPDGSVYIADETNQRIRKVDTNGIITTVAGSTNTPGFSGDEGLATAAQLQFPNDMAIGRDGTIFIADQGNRRIRQVTPDGIISTVAGGGLLTNFNGTRATSVSLNSPSVVTVAPDGAFYIGAAGGLVFHVGLDGIITTFAGGGNDVNGDGGQATAASLGVADVIVGSDDAIYIADVAGLASRVRRVGPDGVITTFAGTDTRGFSGDGGSATAARLSMGGVQNPGAISFGPDGSLYIADQVNQRIRRVGSALPGFTAEEIAIPSEDGSELYRFDGNGRHLSTLNALTGAILYSFAYNTKGQLVSITDGDGLITKVERDSNGKPTAVVSPFGQSNALTVDNGGNLASITNPKSEGYAMGYDTGGLLKQFTDPRGNASTFDYDILGRLLKDQNALTGSQNLTRTDASTGYSVARKTALNRTTSYLVGFPTVGDLNRKITKSDGTFTESTNNTDGTTHATESDGTLSDLTKGPDPRFGMLSAIPANATVTTGGLIATSESTRTVTLTDPLNPLSLTTLTDTATINGRTSRLVYNQAAKTFTATSAANRTSSALIDNLGRTLRTTVTGINPVNNAYDPQGRPATIAQGTGVDERLVNFTYNPQGFLANVTDPLGRQAKYEYDLAGRVTKQILPDNREILFTYDAKGNLTSLLPPGKPAHGFTHSSIDQVLTYVPPPVSGSGNNSTLYEYDLDKALTKITRPDLLTINFSYDTAGRLNKLTTPEGDTNYSYNATTGKLTSIAAPGGESLAYTYNGALLTQTAWSGTLTGNVGYAYDNDFRVSSISVNGGNPFTYQYDNDSLLTSVGNTALGINYTLARNAQNGLLTGSTLGSVTDSYTYNGFAEMTSYLAKFTTTDLFKTDFTRDKLGRITQKVETIGGVVHTFDYAYDLAGRLIEVKQDNLVQERYGYDDNGNRTFLNGSPIADYDAQDRLLRYNNITYDYTANGELKSKAIGTATTSYRYDVLGNLRIVTMPNGTVLDYVIDGQNRRIGKKRNGVLEQGFIYQSQLKPIAELDSSGNVVSRFVYGIGVNVPDFMIKGGVTYRLIKDHLGSPRLVVNTATNAVVQRMDYDAWGNVTSDTNPGFQPFGYAGGIYDRDTGLVRFGARDYDAVVGRWSSKDPVMFEGGDASLYTYVRGSVLNFIDPSGLATFTLGGSANVFMGTFGAGALINPGFGDECFDIGFFGTLGAGAGFGLGAQVTAGISQGNVDSLSGSSLTVFGGVVSGSVDLTPGGGNNFGGSVGVGPGGGWGIMVTDTGTFTLNDLLSSFGYDRCDCN